MKNYLDLSLFCKFDSHVPQGFTILNEFSLLHVNRFLFLLRIARVRDHGFKIYETEFMNERNDLATPFLACGCRSRPPK